MGDKLRDLRGRMEDIRKKLAEVFEQAGAEYDMAKVTAIDGDSQAKLDQIKAWNTELDELHDQVKELESLDGIKRRVDDEGKVQPIAGVPAGKAARKSLGELFVESKAFTGYERGSGQGPVAKLDIDLKTLFQTSAGWDPQDIRIPRVELLPLRPAPHVVEFMPEFATNQAAIVYMEETTATLAAAETAEAGTYPEAAFVLTQRSQPVEKIAVFLPVTDEQLEDVDGARDYVENRLVYALKNRLDLQVLQGNGTAPNLLGTENKSGIQTQALGTDPIFDAVFKLFRKIRDDGFADPGVAFITPAKWEGVRLARTADGLYILGNPADPGPERLWGVPIVQTTAAPATKLLAGDYRNFGGLYVRRGIDVQVSNSHSTFFIEGKLAIRADVRVSMVHFRPKAYGAVTGL